MKKIMTVLFGVSLLTFAACDSRNESNREKTIENAADRKEDQADAVKKNAERAADATEDQGKSQADAEATRIRQEADQKAKALDNQADALREQK